MIKRFRKEKGLNLTEAAKKWHVPASTLCRIERGQRQIGALTALRIHKGTKGALNKQDLRPDLFGGVRKIISRS